MNAGKHGLSPLESEDYYSWERLQPRTTAWVNESEFAAQAAPATG